MQLALTAAIGLGLAARLLPGTVLGHAREEVLARDAAGQPVAAWLIASGAAAFIFILYVHFFYKPLDVLWFVIIGKLGAL